MSSFSRDMLGRSDSFGKSTGVRVSVSTRPSRVARLSAVVSCLVLIPAAPILGLALRAIARRSLRKDATLAASRSLAIAYWAGLAGTCLQLLVVAALAGTAWLSIQAASSAVLERADAARSPEQRLVAPSSVTPAFEWWQFRPGLTHDYTVSNGNAATTSVAVRFETVPTWTSDGPVFAATIESGRSSDR
ncbi:MAG: hypothetical protein AAFZ67_13005 [Planctomycetota bacterium]